MSGEKLQTGNQVKNQDTWVKKSAQPDKGFLLFINPFHLNILHAKTSFYLLQFTIWSQILRRFKNSKQNSGKSTYSTGELYLNIKYLWWSSFSSVCLDEGKVGYGSSSPWICCCKKMQKCSKKNEKHPFDVDVSNLVRYTCLNVNLLRTIATDFLSMHQWHEC